MTKRRARASEPKEVARAGLDGRLWELLNNHDNSTQGRTESARLLHEWTRAFFLKGQHDLVRRHFELVPAGGVPPPMAASIRQFLAITSSESAMAMLRIRGPSICPKVRTALFWGPATKTARTLT